MNVSDSSLLVNNMKLLCVFLAAVVSTALAGHVELPPEMKEMLHNFRLQCETETGVDPALVEEAMKMNFKDDPTFKCFLKCMMINFEVLTEDGVFDADRVKEHMPEEFKAMKGMEVVDACKDVKGSDACETAYELILCVAKTSEEMAEVLA